MPSQRLATAPLAGTCRPFWQQKVPLASEIGLVMQNQVLPEWTSHRTYHTIPCFPAGNFSSKRITPPLAFASYPLIVCQVSTSNAPWLDFRVLVQPGLWGGGGAVLGWDLTEDLKGLMLYESSCQHPKTSNHTSPLALSFLATSAHWRLKQSIRNTLAGSPFHESKRERRRQTDRQTDRQMERRESCGQ